MRDLIHETFQLPGPGGTVIRGDIRLERSDSPQPVLIICHGFKGFKDWGGFPYLCEELASEGTASIIFNFSHNGIGDDRVSFSELERFCENTFSLEADDLRIVLLAIREGKLPLSDCLDSSRIGLIGHSRGGPAVLVVGQSESEVKAVCTLASISEMAIPSEEEQQKWRADGVRYALNTRTGQRMPLGVALLDDMLEGRDRIEKATRDLEKPLLIIHGDSDLSVPIEAAERLDEWAKQSRLHIVYGADHTFGVKHPFDGTTVHLEAVIALMKDFFDQAFGQ